MRGKLLFIVTAFAPENAIGCVRTTKLVKYLVRGGWDLTVVSPKLSEDIAWDHSLVCNELSYIEKIDIPYGEFFRRFLYRKRSGSTANKPPSNNEKPPVKSLGQAIRTFSRKRIKFIYNLTRNFSWKRQVKKYIDENFKENEFDYIFSSYPSASSHLAAKYALKKKIAKKWIADFRDPMAYESIHSRFEYFIYNKIQKNICRNASAITVVSKDLARKLSQQYGIEKKTNYLPNGYDEDDLELIEEKGETENGFLRLVYAGSMYGGQRDLSPVFFGLKELHNKGLINIEKIRFTYAGKDFQIVKDQAGKYELDGILENLGFISRIDSLNLQNTADVILVSTWNSENEQGIVTGKVFECFLLKKPVLVIVNGTKPGGELSEMIDSSGLGISFNSMIADPSQDERLQNFLLNAYKQAIDGKVVPTNANHKYLQSFSYRVLAKKLEDILLSNGLKENQLD
ncbi:glycosyltransferase [Mesotoga sp. UBA5557]|jgi:phosphopantetheinyl transferase (holo-ACP synthase)|uniref:glycosyltransferase n=1 Tax=Mesotoga sp. UBA5557 TaxID=1946857 RepID=UPI0025E7ED20|nr:glycosyltransferase [Mesotoga sp. UBA5557]